MGFSQSSMQQGIVEPQLTLPEVVDKLVQKTAERADALQRYKSKRFYRLDYRGFPASFNAEMVVEMTYQAPGTKHFKIISQGGPQWIIDLIFKRLLATEQEALTEKNRERIALNARNYVFTALERQDTHDDCSYVLAVQPKIPSKLLYRGRVWVDSKDFAVCRIEAEPAKNPSIWISKTEVRHSYVKVGDFWLPSENESISSMRVGGRAVLTIKYQNYEILEARPLKSAGAEQ